MIRSIVSVLGGIAALTLASFAIEAALNPLLIRLFPQVLPGPEALASNSWVRALTFASGFVCVSAGGYVTARLARRLPLRHASAMGIIQAGLMILAMLSTVGNHASPVQWIVTAILSIPAALIGRILSRTGKPLKGLPKRKVARFSTASFPR